MHRHRGPDRRHDPATPCAAVVQAYQAPASAIELDRAIRFGFQMNVDSSTADAETAIASPATSPATGPPIDRASHHVTRTAAIPARAISPTTASGESPPVRKAAGREQVVVESAVVDVAERGRRPEQRHDPVPHERAQHEHVVPLVGVPRPARGEVRKAENGRDHDQPDRDERPARVPDGSALGSSFSDASPARARARSSPGCPGPSWPRAAGRRAGDPRRCRRRGPC